MVKKKATDHTGKICGVVGCFLFVLKVQGCCAVAKPKTVMPSLLTYANAFGSLPYALRKYMPKVHRRDLRLLRFIQDILALMMLFGLIHR
ncbi:MAG: hypothetical protein RSB39_07870, partial [Oscillospiraceae bacterium]